MYKTLLVLVSSLLLLGCSVKPLKPVEITLVDEKVDYLKDVKPILDKRCVVCHSCYNSPCQLKLSSYDGLDRGASKRRVYLSERLRAQEPSRLFIDAKTTATWRKKGFNSVLDSNSVYGTNDSIMLQLLNHKMNNPKSIGEYFSENDDLTCSRNTRELAKFLDENPNSGMPYGFPALKKDEYETIKQWLGQGAPAPSENDESKLKTPSKQAQQQIVNFESFFNKNDAKHKMSTRYIYEHLFLAHLSFKSSPDEFFELVRSYTKAPKQIDEIPTLRPYDDPKVDKFYYRFKKIHSTIVHKTHMVYDLNDASLKRYNELFIEPKWDEEPYLIGYENINNSKPFEVFAQIPASSRYAFLLDNSEYMIRTFIRGPVCKGQIALNVIEDHFWVVFMNPEYDLSLKNKTYFKNQYKNLSMPIESGSNVKLLKTFSDKYINKAIKYAKYRQEMYDATYENGLGLDSIWSGEYAENSPILSIYRHFDSASVHRGVLGNIPKTGFLIDYPLFERIYYSLVAGFDVFGNVGHQVSSRRYMSRLRVEGENNFVNLLPLEDREKIIKSWYKNAENSEEFFISKNESNIKYKHIDSKRELFENIVNNRILKKCNIHFDGLNYTSNNIRHTTLPTEFKTKQDYIDGFKSLIKPGTNFIKFANGTNSNLAYLRIKIPNEKDIVISIVVNRWHDNVSFMFNEKSRLDSSKDELDFIEGFIGSYPNYFIVVDFKDLADFFDMMHNYDGSKKYLDKFLKYSISRGDENFWKTYDWFSKRFYEDKPHSAGLFDLNRYYYKVLK